MGDEYAPGHLARLIEDIAYERGWSLREVARRSDLPAPTVQKIASKTSITVPKRDTLEKLAAGLQVPLTTLLDAAAQDSGLRVERIADRDPAITVECACSGVSRGAGTSADSP